MRGASMTGYVGTPLGAGSHASGGTRDITESFYSSNEPVGYSRRSPVIFESGDKRRKSPNWKKACRKAQALKGTWPNLRSTAE